MVSCSRCLILYKLFNLVSGFLFRFRLCECLLQLFAKLWEGIGDYFLHLVLIIFKAFNLQ